MLLQLPHFFLPFLPLHPASLLPPAFPHLSSCPWVIHVSSLASPFPILFLTFPCLFCAYNLCYLFPVPFPPFFPFLLPADNPLCDLHFCDFFRSSCLLSLFLFFFWIQLLIVVSLLSFCKSNFLISP